MNHLIKKSLLAMSISLACSSITLADSWAVKVTNLTHGNHFTPLLVTSHDSSSHLFEVGSAASTALTLMAECGDTTDLKTAETTAGNTFAAAAAALAPGASVTENLTDVSGTNLSVVSMILPTNDGFMGLEAASIPAYNTTAGASNTHVFFVNGYDSGTEANNELLATDACAIGVAGFPAAPNEDNGSNGTGVTTDADTNTMVHIHRGALGDSNDTGGTSDLNNTIHRWQNPVARIVVTVTQ